MFKQGDAVFIPAVIQAEHEGRTAPIYSVLALGDVPAHRVLPASDALPGVARWLSDWPGMPEVLASMRQDLAELPQWKYSQGNGLRGLAALIAALGGTDGG